MVQILRRIEAGLRARGRTYLEPADFTGHLLAVADTIGAEFFTHRWQDRGPLVRTDASGITRALALLLPARQQASRD